MNIAATATDTSPQTKGKFLLAPIQLLCLSLQYSIRITKVFRYMPIEPQTFFKLIEFLMACLERYLAWKMCEFNDETKSKLVNARWQNNFLMLSLIKCNLSFCCLSSCLWRPQTATRWIPSTFWQKSLRAEQVRRLRYSPWQFSFDQNGLTKCPWQMSRPELQP